MMLLPLLLTMAGGAAAFSGGSVELACSSMSPFHFLTSAQRSPSPYQVFAEFYQDGFYVVRIIGLNDQFKGFLLQARDPRDRSDKVVGIFTQVQGGKRLDCSYQGGAAAHDNGEPKNEAIALWYPNGYTGPVKFKATIVKSYRVYWTDVESNVLDV